MKINKIVIVGGGSSGWMTAATLIKLFPEKEIVIIESKDIPTIGVGESTLGSINNWLDLLGITKESFMKECDASYKLSIKFKGFYKEDDEGFHYPFGQPVFEKNKDFGTPEDWNIKRMLNKDVPVSDYVDTFYPISSFINTNKYTDNLNGEVSGFDHRYDSAVHFDATKFAIWLKNNICIPNGVILINESVTEINYNIDGIKFLKLSNNDEVSADLFIDCTGFKSLLLSKFNPKFINYNNLIPNNKAWATRIPYSNKEKELEPYTTCTAIKNGWVWNIPLWSRIGTGYVYSDNFISKEDALIEYKEYILKTYQGVDLSSLEFKDISFKVGINDKTWIKNVVAIGLSAGFIEPLESNGLFTVHEFLIKLCTIIEREYISQWDIDSYNAITYNLYNDFAVFVSMHYALSVREDSEYWKFLKNKTFFPEIINHEFTNKTSPMDLIIKKFYTNSWGHIGYAGGGSKGLHCIATGMNYNIFPSINIFLKNRGVDFVKRVEDLEQVWYNNKVKWKSIADKNLTLYNYLNKRIYND